VVNRAGGDIRQVDVQDARRTQGRRHFPAGDFNRELFDHGRLLAAHTSAQTRSPLASLSAMLGICLVIMLIALDQTVVGTALPRIVAELQGFALYPWTASAYLMTSAVMIPITGRLGDLYGRKYFVLVAIMMFTIASALCGAAGSMLQLVLARGLQGCGREAIRDFAVDDQQIRLARREARELGAEARDVVLRRGDGHELHATARRHERIAEERELAG